MRVCLHSCMCVLDGQWQGCMRAFFRLFKWPILPVCMYLASFFTFDPPLQDTAYLESVLVPVSSRLDEMEDLEVS